MVQTMYEIRVAGVVPEEDLRDMGAITIAPEQVNTVLYGVSDQAALYGLLDRLRALGVAVVEVRRVPSPSLGEDLEGAVEGEVSDELDD
ncbi:MAG: hypothetical protein ACRDO2_01650 [Nocardioidaceae bacterium]